MIVLCVFVKIEVVSQYRQKKSCVTDTDRFGFSINPTAAAAEPPQDSSTSVSQYFSLLAKTLISKGTYILHFVWECIFGIYTCSTNNWQCL